MTDLDERTVRAVAREADAIGARVYAHAIDIDSGAEIGVGSDTPVVTASVFKVPVLIEYARQVSTGELDPRARIVARAAEATTGNTGLSVFNDDAEWSLRDIATSMITVSDNAATDILCRIVGIDRVNELMGDLGLPDTRLIGDCRALFDSIHRDFGLPVDATDEDAYEHLVAHPERIPTLAICTPSATNRTTPREAARLLRLIWTDRAAPARACAHARQILGEQVWSHRLSSGFPDDRIRISGKTGTIGIVRNEIGAIEFPDGRRYAVGVFVRTANFAYRNPAADRLIGTVGRILVDQCAELP